MLVCRIRAGGGYVRVEGTIWNYLKGGKLGQWVDALKKGDGTPLRTMVMYGPT